MRSSIACARCRRSKVKCLNNGINTPCRACVTSGRECLYPAPASSDRSHRRDTSLGRAADLLGGQDGSRLGRSKPRKLQSLFLGSHSSIRAPVDALNSSVVTSQVWLELFDIWQQHFSIDLPFLHPTSFSKLLREAKSAPLVPDFNTPKPDNSSDLPAIPQELLLAFLTLTSRFHLGLVAHHAPSSGSRSNPQIATEYYAAVCRDKLLSLSDTFPDMARVQSLLILAFHEWGDGQSIRAWMYLGEAIRFGRMLGYGIPDSADDRSAVLDRIDSQPTRSLPESEEALQGLETRRRTFWACFALERHLSSGVLRPLSIDIRDVRIPLPASDKSYLFNDKAKTSYITDWSIAAYRSNGEHASNPAGQVPSSDSPRERDNYENCIWETGSSEGALSRYVKSSEVFNSVLQWAGRGGRLTEQYAPWDNQSTWYRLNQSVDNMINKLPRDLTLSPANISAHIQTRSSVSFTLLHTSLLLSKMILHREFLPFLPLVVSYPKGPVDNLSPFSSTVTDESAGDFWKDSAVALFKSSKDLLNLYQTCSEWRLLAETPLVVFASYMIATLDIYSLHFPWMDLTIRGNHNNRDQESSRKSAELVATFLPRFRMAEGWLKTIARLHHLFSRTKRELRKSYTHIVPSPSDQYNRRQLPSLKITDDVYSYMENFLGPDIAAHHDHEMLDAAYSKPHAQADRDHAETVARQTWHSLNDQHAQQEPNGSHYPQGQQSPGASRSGYPPISPQAASQPYTPSSLPQFLQNSPYPQPCATSNEAVPASEKMESSSSRANSQPWTHEKADSWLDSLETVFGANDVVAFAEAIDWMELTTLTYPVKGWLRLVWS